MKDNSEVVMVTYKISIAQKEELRKLADELQRGESELVREAIMVLLGVYHGSKKEISEDALAKAVDEGVA